MTQGQGTDPQYPPPQASYPQAPAGHYVPPPYGNPFPHHSSYGVAPMGYSGNLPKKHSGVGIASAVVAVLSGLSVVATFTVAVVLTVNDPTVFDDEEGPATVALRFLLVLAVILSLIGLGLGIGAVVQREHKKTLGVVGLILNGAIVVGVVGLIVLGALA